MTATSDVIVVGVDGTITGDEALRFAYAEARATGHPMEVVTAWSPSPADVSRYLVHADCSTLEAYERRAKDQQDAAIDRVCGVHPGVPMTRRIMRGGAGNSLVVAARHAGMLVVGSGNQSRFRAAVHGSVSRYCSHHAECRVAVVPAPVAQAAGIQR